MRNIAIIGPTYPYKGGISHFTTILVQHLRKSHNVDFISWRRQYPSFLYPVALQDKQSKQPIKTDARFLLDFFNPITWIKTVVEIRKNKTDVLLLTWASPIQSPIYFFISLFVKIFTRARIVYICHNVLPHENTFYDKPFIKLAFLFADSFIVHSSDDKKILESLVHNKLVIKGFLPTFDIFQQEIKYNSPALKRELGLYKKVLLFFGYIRPYKGLKYLIEAMPEILNEFPETSLLVVGEFWSKNKDTYLALVKQLHLEKHILFIDNYVPNEELGKYFFLSDVVILPYISATQSASLQTSYAFNKPVIATAVGGLKDVQQDGITGYIINPEDSKDIAEKVHKFYNSWKPTKEMRTFMNQFDWENYVQLINKS